MGKKTVKCLFISIILLIPMSLFIVSCGNPSPTRVVEMYLEEISSDDIDIEFIESITTEEYREEMALNSLIGDIAGGSENLYDLFVPLMSSEDAEKVESEYEFMVSTREFVEGGLALVKVFVQTRKRRGVKTDDTLNSKTLHPALKEVLTNSWRQEFQFKLKLRDEKWKIRDLTLPPILEQVMIERAGATVTIPLPERDEAPEAPSDEESDEA